MRLLLALSAAALLAACGGGDEEAERPTTTEPAAATAPDRFDSARAWRYLKYQVGLGERPAGSPASRKLAADIAKRLPNSRFQKVPGGLRNVIGEIPGKDSDNIVLVGAHYDTKDIDGFVGANDAASGTAVTLELAREIKPRTIGPTLLFVFFDGEETPRGTPDSQFYEKGLRGSKVAARKLGGRVDRMILLDFVGDKELEIPREQYSDATLWARLRSAARRAGAQSVFPDYVSSGIQDDHIPFIERGIPSIDLIDFDFPCWHRTCDDLSVVSEKSLDKVGETMRELLPRL